LLANETLEKILRDHYASDSPDSKAVQLLIQTQGRGWDLPIRTLILKLHHYSQTLRDPQAWFAAQTAMFESPEPVQWAEWLVAGVRDWRDRWLPALQSLSTDNTKAAECASALAKLPAQPSRPECAAALACAFAADQEWPRGRRLSGASRSTNSSMRRPFSIRSSARIVPAIRWQRTGVGSVRKCSSCSASPGSSPPASLTPNVNWAWWISTTSNNTPFACLLCPTLRGNGARNSVSFSSTNTRTSTTPRTPFSRPSVAKAQRPTVSWSAMSSKASTASASPIRTSSRTTSPPGPPGTGASSRWPTISAAANPLSASSTRFSPSS